LNKPTTPRQPIGTLEWGSQDPASLLSDELAGRIKGAVNRLLNEASGVPHEQLVAAVLNNLAVDGIKLELAQALVFIESVVDGMAVDGRLTRLSYMTGALLHHDYYPAGMSITVTPAKALDVTDHRSPPPALSIEQFALFTGLKAQLDYLSVHNRQVILNVLDRYCPHCGQIDEGHKCQ
jgi:hypothetical protein